MTNKPFNTHHMGFQLIFISALTACTLYACSSSDTDTTDGINETDTAESVSRDDYGRDSIPYDRQTRGGNHTADTGSKEHETGRNLTTGDDGKIKTKKDR